MVSSRHPTTRSRGQLTLPAAFALFAPLVPAQPGAPSPGPFYQWSAAYVHQAEADLDRGGEFSVSRASAELGVAWFLDRRTRVGVNFAYARSAYDFTRPGEGSRLGPDPWSEIHAVELGLFWTRSLENGWQLFASPTVGSYAESAFASDGLAFSLVGGARKQVSDTFSYGLGLVANTGLSDSNAFPFLSIEWEFAPNWSLQNPFRPGPAGPAGLEVAYAGDAWSLAFGAAYRSWRFRIDGEGETRDGLAEHTGIPVFVRYTHTLTETLTLDLYGGVFLAGELELEDEDGRGLGRRDDTDAAPFFALSLSGRF
jgi:hypothetical protein